MKLESLLFTAIAIPLIASAQPVRYDDDKPAPPPAEQKTPAKDTAKKASLSNDEVKIVAHVHHINVMEISLGKMAKLNGTPAVKRYGEMSIRDHGTADKELTAFAKKKGLVKIPAKKPETEAEKSELKEMTKAMAGLEKLKGADFDREYLRMMVDGHATELAKSDVFIASATDPDLKLMLETRKTSLQRHADTARELQRGNVQASVVPKQPQPDRAPFR